MTFATALLMAHGHDPEAVADYAWRDIEAFMITLPYFSQPQFGGGGRF
ncbi:hypothetical protein HYG81_15145 [Natrinema zhouii]|uniref:Uncharacterized protein n=1 Tax=Natrinema zhouii TaxID=1710539 RepID=A0A7D6CP90_9EURY|nr:hypothetical protein [Natrinema zhouii]QLK25409.1 hypothetical protein HYG81_15145 [Natrinema zhouii]